MKRNNIDMESPINRKDINKSISKNNIKKKIPNEVLQSLRKNDIEYLNKLPDLQIKKLPYKFYSDFSKLLKVSKFFSISLKKYERKKISLRLNKQLFELQGALPLDSEFIDYNDLFLSFAGVSGLFLENIKRYNYVEQERFINNFNKLMISFWKRSIEILGIIQEKKIDNLSEKEGYWKKEYNISIIELKDNVNRFKKFVYLISKNRKANISKGVNEIYNLIIADHLRYKTSEFIASKNK